jgi:hypothetical protein
MAVFAAEAVDVVCLGSEARFFRVFHKQAAYKNSTI